MSSVDEFYAWFEKKFSIADFYSPQDLERCRQMAWAGWLQGSKKALELADEAILDCEQGTGVTTLRKLAAEWNK